MKVVYVVYRLLGENKLKAAPSFDTLEEATAYLKDMNERNRSYSYVIVQEIE